MSLVHSVSEQVLTSLTTFSFRLANVPAQNLLRDRKSRSRGTIATGSEVAKVVVYEILILTWFKKSGSPSY